MAWKKEVFEVTFGAEQKVAKLKEHIQTLTGTNECSFKPPLQQHEWRVHGPICYVFYSGIPPAMMKLMYKGLLKNESTLQEAKITNGIKMMVVGSTVNDVLTIQPPNPKVLREKKPEQTGWPTLRADLVNLTLSTLTS